MTGNCFVRQSASLEIIANVTGFCAECYKDIIENETIFYDMKNCRYLCACCHETLAETLDINCEPLDSQSNALF